MPRSKRFVFTWACPSCGIDHRYSWSDTDAPEDGCEVWMKCEGKGPSGGCGRMSLFAWGGGRWTYKGRTTDPA